MNYFELFGLHETYKLDQNELDRRFMQLQKSAHPDVSHEDSKSILLNKAYSVLSDPIQRAEYVMHIAGYDRDDNNMHPVEYELFELSDAISSADADQSNRARERLIIMQNETYSKLVTMFEARSDSSKIFEQINKAKYIKRILER